MSIEKTCENCLSYDSDKDCYWCTRNFEQAYSNFIPSEKAIREDEKEKIIKRLEEKFNDLVCSDLFLDEAYAIKDIIDELKEE